MAFGIAAFLGARGYPAESRIVPSIYAGLLLLLSAVLLVLSLVGPRGAQAAPERAEPGTRVFLASAMILAYIFLIGLLGFYVATTLFLVVFMAVMRATSIAANLAISLGTATLIYACFDVILHIQTPRGLFF